jgi:serine/threonine-protein kinase
VVDGKYRVERGLGQGAMGVVMLARHVQLDVPVAIKVVTPEGLETPEAAARFVREARASAKLESEHVVRVTDVGRLPSGAPYMVMELLRGQDLAEVVAGDERLPISDAVDYVIQALEALAEAHAAGIVHRDLKPSNLFRADRASGPMIKVLDFGISKAAEAGVSLTKTHSLMGSPAYMSPEQILATKDVDARADVWSMGIVLYELLAGVTPFDGDQVGALLTSVLTSPIPPVETRRAGLPEGLAAVVHGCLERDIEKRIGSAAELALALAPFASSAGALMVERVVRHAGGTGTVRSPALYSPPSVSRSPAARTMPLIEPERDTMLAAPASRALSSPGTGTLSSERPAPLATPAPASGVPIWLVSVLVAAAAVVGWLAHR